MIVSINLTINNKITYWNGVKTIYFCIILLIKKLLRQSLLLGISIDNIVFIINIKPGNEHRQWSTWISPKKISLSKRLQTTKSQESQ